MPDTKQAAGPVFVTVRRLTIWPAPAPPGTTSKEPDRLPPAHGEVAGFGTVVVGRFTVTVRTCVTVCVTVIVCVFVPPPPQPARTSTIARSRPALMRSVFATADREPPRARRARRRSEAAPVRASPGRGR